MISKIKKALTFKAYRSLVYSEQLRDAYLDASVCGNRLKGKNVLVTGATGGIGIAIALRYVREESNVILAGRDENKLQEVKTYIQKKTGSDNIRYIVMDQCLKASIEAAVEKLKKTDGFVDILINNAGIWTDVDKHRRFRNVTEEEFMSVWRTNFEGTSFLTHLIADEMIDRKIEGCVVNIASICAEFRNFQYTPYGISKSAIAAFTKAMRKKYALITFVCIEPGSVATNMGDLKVGDNIAKGCNTLSHPALPEEIAAQVAFFSCGFGHYIKEEIVASACETL